MKLIRVNLSILILVFFCINVSGQQYDFGVDRKINKINIIGLNILDQNYIRSLLKSTVGEDLSPRYIAEDIKQLFQLGFAEDISVDIEILEERELVNITFNIVEKPRIQNIIFRGNRSIKSKTLNKDLTSKIYSILNSELIARDILTLQAQYKQKKINNVKILYEIEKLPNNRVNLIFEIIEKPKTYVTDINIYGSEYFYPLDLKRRFVSHEIDCFSWITSTGILDEDRINNDLSVLYQLYLDNGFLKVNIKRPRIKVYHFKDYSKAVIDITIEEGERYFVSDININGVNDQDLLDPTSEIIDNMQLSVGDVFNHTYFIADRTYLDSFYQDRGYAYNRIIDKTTIDDENRLISIAFEVNKFGKVYINRVDIEGNYSTRDYVIRRELALHDNQLYRLSKVRESQVKLDRLGFFDQETGVNFIRQENLDKTIDYKLRLKETLTGSLNLSLTYSEGSGLGVATQVSKKNFLGRGQTISLNLNSDLTEEHDISLSLIEPYLFDSKYSSISSIGFNQHTNKNSDDEINFQESDYLLSQSFGQQIWANWRLYYKLSFRRIFYDKVSEEGLELLNFFTDHDERTVGFRLNYNTVNHPLFSTRGMNMNLYYDLVGIIPGSNVRYNRLKFDIQYFKNLTASNMLVFMARYRFTRLFEVDDRLLIPPEARLALGGITNLRGFAYNSVDGATNYTEIDPSFSLTDLKADDYDTYLYYKTHENGIISSLLNFEVLFPISKNQSNVRGVLFFDAGNVWSEPETYKITGAELDYAYYKMSFGAGVRVITPAGVLRFEHATVIDPKPKDLTGKLEFYIGSLF